MYTPLSYFPAKPSHLSDCTEDLLLMGVHFSEGSDLGQVNIFPVAQGNNFIKSKYEIKAVFRDLTLLQHTAVLRDLKTKYRHVHNHCHPILNTRDIVWGGGMGKAEPSFIPHERRAVVSPSPLECCCSLW